MAGFQEGFRGSELRYYPVILLLDVSGSMDGDPINALHAAVTEMVNSFAAQRTREKMIKIAIITFGGDRANLHMSYTDAPDVQANGVPRFSASGMTPLGSALREAKKLNEDKSTTPGKWYIPAVVLVSDGAPNDDWENALHDFIHNGRTAKCIRIGVPIGPDADANMMETFTGDRAMIFYAQDVSTIADAFKNVVISITKSHDKAKPIEAQPTVKRNIATTVKRPSRHDDEDEDE